MKRSIRLLFLASLIALLLIQTFASASAEIDSTIRVYLRRLKITDSMSIETKGTYMLGDGSMLFSDGTKMNISLRDNTLVLHTGTAAIRLGESTSLIRCEGEMPAALTIGESGLYEGDLHLSIKDGVIRPILHIHIEDYLLGVVPYEMGDSFPLEALKAQAIAARTYALRKSGSSDDYDVEDTTNDQAYRGRSSSSPLSEQAVLETEGLVGTYDGGLAQCFYSASNGGQTELGQHVWPTSEPDAYGYMDMRDDPYDYENEASVVKRFTLAKKPGVSGVGTALHHALVEALSDDLMAMGAETEPDCVRFDEIVSLEAVTPKFEGESRLYTEMAFTVKLSVRDCLYRDSGQGSEQAVVGATVAPLAVTAEPTPSPTPAPTATPAYSAYRSIDEAFTVTLPIFTTVEQAMGISINTTQNELITVVDIGSAYMIESRRFGHGVGMSQRGAQQMAKKYNMTYDQILNFYYPGLVLASFQGTAKPMPTADIRLAATPAPTPSPTPRPTLMPVTAQDLPKGAYVAVVSNIDADSSLNLREFPSLSAEVLRRLYKDQRLVVLSVSKDGWAHVKTDVIEGYVRSEYLQTAGE